MKKNEKKRNERQQKPGRRTKLKETLLLKWSRLLRCLNIEFHGIGVNLQAARKARFHSWRPITDKANQRSSKQARNDGSQARRDAQVVKAQASLSRISHQAYILQVATCISHRASQHATRASRLLPLHETRRAGLSRRPTLRQVAAAADAVLRSRRTPHAKGRKGKDSKRGNFSDTCTSEPSERCAPVTYTRLSCSQLARGMRRDSPQHRLTSLYDAYTRTMLQDRHGGRRAGKVVEDLQGCKSKRQKTKWKKKTRRRDGFGQRRARLPTSGWPVSGGRGRGSETGEQAKKVIGWKGGSKARNGCKDARMEWMDGRKASAIESEALTRASRSAVSHQLRRADASTDVRHDQDGRSKERARQV